MAQDRDEARCIYDGKVEPQELSFPRVVDEVTKDSSRYSEGKRGQMYWDMAAAVVAR